MVPQAEIRGGAGPLQLYVHQPQGEDAQPEIALVIVHPCTTGGCAAAVEDIAQDCCRQGYLTVSFDLRGAGSSGGFCSLGPWPFVSGCAEVSDVLTVAHWVKETLSRDVWLVGVSAGGPIAGAALSRLPFARGYVGIAHTFGLVTTLIFFCNTARLLVSRKPKLFIMGTSDTFTSVAVFYSQMALMRRPREWHIEPGAGHFDIELRPYSRLDAELLAAFVSSGSIVGARARTPHVVPLWLPSLWTGGPCCIITIVLVLALTASAGLWRV